MATAAFVIACAALGLGLGAGLGAAQLERRVDELERITKRLRPRRRP